MKTPTFSEPFTPRGVAAFAEDEIARVAGKTTEELRGLFPGRKHLEVVHRDNLVLL